MRLLNTLFLLLFFHLWGWSQDICVDPKFVKGDFTLGGNDFCHDENITIVNTGGVEEPKYYFNYNSGLSFAEVQAYGVEAEAFTFKNLTKSGIYTVIQVGKKDGKETVSCIRDIKVRVSNQPVFSYNFCPGNPSKLSISIPANPLNNYNTYTIDILGLAVQVVSSSELPFNKTFDLSSTAGSFTIVGVGGSRTCGSSAPPVTFNFNPSTGTKLDYFPNISQIKITEDQKIQLDIAGEFGEKYTLKRYTGGSPFSSAVTVRNDINSGPFLDTPPTPLSTSYCYFVDKNNTSNCGVFTLSSAELCSAPLQSVTKISITQNLLRWIMYRWSPIHRYPQFSQINPPTITIQKIEDGVKKDITNGIINSTFSYSDSDVKCSKKYCYRIKVNTSGRVTGVNYSGISYSNEVCVDHKEILPPPEDVYVSTSDAFQNTIFFENPSSSSKYALNKWFLLKSNGTDFLKIGEVKTPDLAIPDENFPVTQSETYKIKYLDICENESELSNPISSVFLNQVGDNNLEWTTSSPFSDDDIDYYEIIYINNDLQQEITRKQEPSGSSKHTIDTTPFTSTGTFVVRAISVEGKESLSNPVSIPIKGALFLPSAFTPNSVGPEENEIFIPKGSINSIKDFSMEIFTPRGYKVAEIKDPLLGWDGLKSDGTKADQGPYFYKMNVVMKNGQVINKNGSFSLLK